MSRNTIFYTIISLSLQLPACMATVHCNSWCNYTTLSPIDSPKLLQPLRHGWTILLAMDMRADSLIVLLTLSELKIAPIMKILPWSVLQVVLQVRAGIIIVCMHVRGAETF